MRDRAGWRPTKYLLAGDTLRGNPAGLAPGSRFIGDVVARAYHAAIRDHARGRLLDVGCGEVPLFQAYEPLVTENVCIDWAPTPERLRHVDHVCDLDAPIPLPDAGFDTVLATDVIEHLRNPARLFAEIARLLRPRGKLILGVPFLYWIHEEPFDFHRYTEYQLRELCRASGLEVVTLEPYGGSPEVLADIAAKHLGWSRLLSSVHLGLVRVAAATAPWKRVSRRTARRFPLGYLLVAARP